MVWDVSHAHYPHTALKRRRGGYVWATADCQSAQQNDMAQILRIIRKTEGNNRRHTIYESRQSYPNVAERETHHLTSLISLCISPFILRENTKVMAAAAALLHATVKHPLSLPARFPLDAAAAANTISSSDIAYYIE